MIERTEHGINICNQIDEDAYGRAGTLSEADVYGILENMKDNANEGGKLNLADLLEGYMDKLHREFPDIVT